MASMRDIKRRKGSVQSTQQITKAMKLVSTVKLQRSKGRAERSKTYFSCMYDTVASMLSKAGNIDHPYLRAASEGKKGIIVITGNRGLAGGYNSNIVKLVKNGEFDREKTVVYAIGSKGRDMLKKLGYDIREDYSEMIDEPAYIDAMTISNRVLDDFSSGEIGEIYIAYTGFKNTVTHIPTLLKLLPIKIEDERDKEENKAVLEFEPETEEAVDLIIPKYITSLIYGAMLESAASENGARMQAMDNATSNAEDMISQLSLLYNRARQSSITQELTEIIAGAEAIS